MNCLESMCELLSPISAYRLHENSLVFYELASYYEGLKLVETALAALKREGFVQKAEDYGLRCWERMIRSTAQESTSIENRRDVVLYTLGLMPWDFNLDGMLRGLKSIGLTCALLEDTAARTVTVKVCAYTGTLRAYEDILQRITSILPAHLNVLLDIGAYAWDALDALDRSCDMQEDRNLNWDAFEADGVIAQ